jgi:hypothetical protein
MTLVAEEIMKRHFQNHKILNFIHSKKKMSKNYTLRKTLADNKESAK